MDRNLYAVFVAGGKGTRMGSSTPKQFLLLDGIPVLQRTISAFVSAFPDVKVLTVLPREHIQTWRDLCMKYDFDVRQQIVEGGITRFHSVRNALAHVPDGAVVMIHDGVRPLVSTSLLKAMAAKMDECRALIPALPVTDSLKWKDGTLPEPDRSSIIAVQTPQVFLSEDIRSAYTLAYDTAFTDDASVAQRKGIPLSYIEGERYNIKITTPDDLRLAALLISDAC